VRSRAVPEPTSHGARGGSTHPVGAPESQGNRGAFPGVAGTGTRTWTVEWGEFVSRPTEGRRAVTDFADVEALVRRLESDGDGFLILSGPGERFMQVGALGEGYLLEFHDPAAERRARRGGELSEADVIRAFRLFHAGHSGFPDENGWTAIGPDGEPVGR